MCAVWTFQHRNGRGRIRKTKKENVHPHTYASVTSSRVQKAGEGERMTREPSPRRLSAPSHLDNKLDIFDDKLRSDFHADWLGELTSRLSIEICRLRAAGDCTETRLDACIIIPSLAQSEVSVGLQLVRCFIFFKSPDFCCLIKARRNGQG